MKKHTLLISVLLLSACDNQPTTVVVTPETKHAYPTDVPQEVRNYRIPESAFRNPGAPERLLDSSSERVTIALGSRDALNEISRMATQDPPTRVELNCLRSDALCTEAKTLFVNRNIPAEFVDDGDEITLVYERLVARDCDSRFVDNSQNNANLNHPALGCSVVGNTVQMVSDKRQFTNPSLMDMQDGSKTVQSYRRYQQPPVPVPSRSLLRNIKTD